MMNFKFINLYQNIREFYPSFGVNFLSVKIGSTVCINGIEVDAGRIIFENNQIYNYDLSKSKNAISIVDLNIQTISTEKRITYLDKNKNAIELYKSDNNLRVCNRIINFKTFELIFDFKKNFGSFFFNDLIFGNLQPFDLNFPLV